MLASNSRQSSCLSSLRAKIAARPGPAGSRRAQQHTVSAFVPRRRVSRGPSASGSGEERWAPGCSADTPPRPVTRPRPSPEPARPGPNVRRHPGRGARPHSLTMAARPRCAVQGSRLPSAPRHAPPALVIRPRPRPARRPPPRPLGRAPRPARSGPFPPPRAAGPRRGPRSGRSPGAGRETVAPEACAPPLRARSR